MATAPTDPVPSNSNPRSALGGTPTRAKTTVVIRTATATYSTLGSSSTQRSSRRRVSSPAPAGSTPDTFAVCVSALLGSTVASFVMAGSPATAVEFDAVAAKSDPQLAHFGA